MKRLILLIVLLVGVLCDISAQDKYPAPPTSNSDEIKSFIINMYNNKLYEDYDFLQRYCSAKLLKKLQDTYPYDSDGIAYATWLFRSGQQDVKSDLEDKSGILDVKPDGNEWYVYTAWDMGWVFTNRIQIINKCGEILINDICSVEE